MLVRATKLTVESAAAAPDWQALRPAGDPGAVGGRLNSAFRRPPAGHTGTRGG